MQFRMKRGFSLVEIMVVIVIIAALAAWLLPKYLSAGKSADGKTTASPMQAARGIECTNNLQQIRSSLQMVSASDERPPQTLTELPGLPSTMLKCPVGGMDYIYDPAAGKVGCPHPGHQAY